MRGREMLILSCGLLMALLAQGCGGGGSEGAGRLGELGIGVRFPEDGGAKIPSHAESVRIQVLAAADSSDTTGVPGTPLVPDTIINRPSGGGLAEATIQRIPVGKVIVRALAHPQQNGLGPALAHAQTWADIRANQTTDVTLTLAAIVDRVVANPDSLLMLPDERDQVVAKALDAVGQILLDASLQFSSDDPAVATIDAQGKVLAKGVGTTTLRARHAPSGKEATVPVKVVEARVVRVDVAACHPATVPGRPVQFKATAWDDTGEVYAGAAFDWRVEDGALGQIDANGEYTPHGIGKPWVVATEQSNGVEGRGSVTVANWVVLVEWTTGDDADLHVFDATKTKHAYFGQLSVPIGTHLGDTTTGPAKEAFAGNLSAPGRYPVAVNFFAGSGSYPGGAEGGERGATQYPGYLTGMATFRAAEEPDDVIVPFTLAMPNSNGGYPVTCPTESWARPFDVVIEAGRTAKAVEPDLGIELGPPGTRNK